MAYSRVKKQNNTIVLLTDDRVFEIHSFNVIYNQGLALGHYLVRSRTTIWNADIPHIKMINDNVEDMMRCVPVSKFEIKLVSFPVQISDCEHLRFGCVNVLKMEMLHSNYQTLKIFLLLNLFLFNNTFDIVFPFCFI